MRAVKRRRPRPGALLAPGWSRGRRFARARLVPGHVHVEHVLVTGRHIRVSRSGDCLHAFTSSRQGQARVPVGGKRLRVPIGVLGFVRSLVLRVARGLAAHPGHEA